MGVHGAVASKALGESAVDTILEDWRTADIDEKLRATLGLVEKLTLDPAAVGPGDVAPVRAAGVTREAIVDAVYVCYLFQIITRVADALDFEVPTAEALSVVADRLLRRGYRM